MPTLESREIPIIVVTFDEDGFAAISFDGGETVCPVAGFWSEPNELRMWSAHNSARWVLREEDGTWYLNKNPLRASDVDMSKALDLPYCELLFVAADMERSELVAMIGTRYIDQPNVWNVQPYIGELPEASGPIEVTLTKRHSPTPLVEMDDATPVDTIINLGPDDACRVMYTPGGVFDEEARVLRGPGRRSFGTGGARQLTLNDPRDRRWSFADEDEKTLTLMRPEMSPS